MKFVQLLKLIVFSLISILNISAQTNNHELDNFLIKKMKKSGRIGMQAAYISNGELAWAGSYGGSARFWYLIADYDNDEALKSIHCPTLLLFAEHDINVDPEQNIEHFNHLFDNTTPDNFTIKVMEGGQHGFYKVSDRCVGWDIAMQQPFDPLFQNEVRNWLIKLDCSSVIFFQ